LSPLEKLGGGNDTTSKLSVDAIVPLPLVTEIGPLVAPAGTVVVTWASESTVKLAAVPLKLTDVVPVKFAPVMVTAVPTGPLNGETAVMIGGLPGSSSQVSA
jgi:hypothetical protein